MTEYNFHEVPNPTGFRVRNGIYRAELSFVSQQDRNSASIELTHWCVESLMLDRWAIYREGRFFERNGFLQRDCYIIICEFADLADAALFKMIWNTGR